jgi:3-methyladenine DNA glycosylase/8-oxoguanine DNA glycosylase
VAAATLDFPLVGAGGEPVDLWRSLVSHGLTELPPFRVDEEGRTLEVTVAVDRTVRTLRIRAGAPGVGIVEPLGRSLGARQAAAALALVRKMLRLDEDLSPFYERAATDPELVWATAGAGRLLRSPTVFEDVVKTICTTNCAWGATVRMVSALVADLGAEAPDGRRAFPTAAAMAAAGEDWYRGVARAGYRGAYLRSLAASVAEGTIDLEELADADSAALPDNEVAARLLALPGVGPYAAAHVMLLLGRYSRLVLDAWTRPKYARLVGRKQVSDAAIARRFRRYREFAGLAFWLFLTRDWVEETVEAT